MKKIDKLLNNIDEDKYLDNEKPLSENEKEKIFNMTMDKIKNSSNQSKSKGKIISLKKTVAIILASVLMISTLSFAADYFSFDTQLVNLLNINKENEYLINGSGANIDKSVEFNGVKITATQVISDKNSLYIILKLKTKDEFSHSFKSFNEFNFEVKSNGDYRPSSSATFKTIKSEDDDPHTSTLLITMEQEDINNSDIRLIFKDFGYSPYNKAKGEYGDFVTLIKGSWTLKFKLNCKDTSKTYVINKSYKVDNRTVRVKTVTLSPLSVRIKSNGKYNKFISKVTMKDGTEYSGDDFFISNTSSYSTIGMDLFGRSESYASFSKILNPKDIKSITINDEIEVMMP
ncbi:DUF4179 domain-containing protein [Intestinibacter bartlettii]|uniref:DUF4179 domain-containing protein n=1 Tax=Intestinibacter bartlettii CAG:1329 TaxID=1263063 RepID=R5XGD4_9FIRM|nr:DUF4179 domain-containing protein [Intestinibacter bartlettii]CDA11484.1 uncharacterized protein BN488_02511 [Intestinibacter bartlettii CAG:1329]